jgi:acyl dehydratase
MKHARLYFEDVQVGDELPPLAKGPIQQIQLTRYAGASGDFNPIHQDAAFARAAGMGDVFAHGMLTMGFAAQAVTDWAGVGTVRKIGVRFTALVRLGDVVTCRGAVRAKRSPAAGRRGESQVDLDIWAENPKGEKVVTGTATVALASRDEA